MLKSVLCSMMAWTLLAAGASVMAEEFLDPQLPAYRPIDKLEGKIVLVGSDTMSQVAAEWRDRFQQFYPNVEITITVKGAANAMPAVMAGEATIGLLSYEATPEEIAAFTKAKGYAPKLVVPTLERIGVYVHECNPVESLTLAQVDAIFSKSLKRGEAKEITTWGAAGVSGDQAAEKISLRGRSATTGSQVFFQSLVLQGGEFRAGMTEEKDNLTLVKAIQADPNAIGFSGEMYQISGIKAVPISWKAGEAAYEIDSLADEHGSYPLVRPLQFVIDQAPDKELPAAEREFLKYVFSHSGQEDVVKAGFHPISAAPAKTALSAVGLNTLN
jgi:phosphate transport system substrate-binding protein